ncbi:MAG: DEAD/DEAH box helicase, partial [Phycisphaerales bacterium]|nr:DEAD/DEAH box helicase [Phycisphaerales bacterium]
MMVVLHANWHRGSLHLWGESARRFVLLPDRGTERVEAVSEGSTATATVAIEKLTDRAGHSYAIPADELRSLLCSELGLSEDVLSDSDEMELRLPRDLLGPWPSDRLSSAVGGIDGYQDAWLGSFVVPTVRLAADDPIGGLLAMARQERTPGIEQGHSIKWFISVARFVLELLSDQRFIPSLLRSDDGQLEGLWRPWLLDEEMGPSLAGFLHSMPPVVRAISSEGEHPWPLFESITSAMAEHTIRRVLIDDGFVESLEDRPLDDPHVAWLHGLLKNDCTLPSNGEFGHTLFLDARRWINRLDEVDRNRALRGCLLLEAPDASGPDAAWRLAIGLETNEEPPDRIFAEDIWSQTRDAMRLTTQEDLDPQEVLISELGRAARLYPKLEPLLNERTPSGVDLTTAEVSTFLTEFHPLLAESGFGIDVPDWWGSEDHRIGVRLQIDTPDHESLEEAGTMLSGLDSAVQYRWQITVGRTPLSIEQLQALSNQKSSIVSIDGKWVQVDPEQIRRALAFFERHENGTMTLVEAMRLSAGEADHETGLPIWGLDATGWAAQLLTPPDGDARFENIEQPERFIGTLRPYQLTGLSWLRFLDRFGLGACLADDMGLGKTVQLIALLQDERARLAKGVMLPPTLLVVPTSVMGNWARELERFAPEITFHIQHGPGRPTGAEFKEIAEKSDVVITTYALVVRDQETLDEVQWHRVVLDEAQYIKNPPTKQTAAIRSLNAARRVALTGTPVENRLTELWSIMEFCNPGYLGEAADFRRRYARPIERHRDSVQADHLRRLVQPFILRRLKTDRNVISDLPGCVETKEYANLTSEQAALYEEVVKSMMQEVDRASGIQRRGLILALLGRLKQICNHPAQMSEKEELNRLVAPDGADVRQLSSRSGKARRMMTLLEEVLATGEQALVFTQYRRMGQLLSGMIEHDLGCNTLFLHGGTPVPRRQKMIDQFQSGDGSAPVFVLSLKAGGLGLNLTAANHVFHFDRWWNPAVERQATDRAYRIGQSRTVHVHKFVCLGTLEERIDQMIEEKTALAEHIIGAGDDWLTEMTSTQLREMLRLQSTAMEVEG